MSAFGKLHCSANRPNRCRLWADFKIRLSWGRGQCCTASEGSSEPTLSDAALCTNVRSFGPGQKRDKINGSFAKGLWHKTFQ